MLPHVPGGLERNWKVWNYFKSSSVLTASQAPSFATCFQGGWGELWGQCDSHPTQQLDSICSSCKISQSDSSRQASPTCRNGHQSLLHCLASL